METVSSLRYLCGRMLCETCIGLAVKAAEAASERRALMERREALEATGESCDDLETLALHAADEKRRLALETFLRHRQAEHPETSRRESSSASRATLQTTA